MGGVKSDQPYPPVGRKYRFDGEQFVRSAEPSGSACADPQVPIVRHILAGNPEAGSIHIFRQKHLLGRDRDPAVIEGVAAVQVAILREIERQGFGVVIAEDRARTIGPRETYRRDLLNAALLTDDVLRYFRKGELPYLFSTEQKKIAARGAAELYAALFDDVTLHRSYTPENLRMVEEIQTERGSDGRGALSISMEWRDRWVMREALSVLHSGQQKIAIVFGADHFFTRDDFSAELHASEVPDIWSYHWPLLMESAPSARIDMSNELALRDCKHPEKQERLVEEIDALTEWGFGCLLTDRARWLALPKLYRWNPGTDSQYVNMNAQEVLSCLIGGRNSQLSDEILARIMRMYADREGIFAEFEE